MLYCIMLQTRVHYEVLTTDYTSNAKVEAPNNIKKIQIIMARKIQLSI